MSVFNSNSTSILIILLIAGLILGVSISGTDLLNARSEASVQLASQQLNAQQELEIQRAQAENAYQKQLAELQYQQQLAEINAQKKVLNMTLIIVISIAATGIVIIFATSVIRLARVRAFASQQELSKIRVAQISNETSSEWMYPGFRRVKVIQARQKELEMRVNELQKKAKEQEIIARELAKTIAAWESSNSQGS